MTVAFLADPSLYLTRNGRCAYSTVTDFARLRG